MQFFLMTYIFIKLNTVVCQKNANSNLRVQSDLKSHKNHGHFYKELVNSCMKQEIPLYLY
jgi:hypothetical protein